MVKLDFHYDPNMNNNIKKICGCDQSEDGYGFKLCYERSEIGPLNLVNSTQRMELNYERWKWENYSDGLIRERNIVWGNLA